MSWLQITVDSDAAQISTVENIFTLFDALAITYSDGGQQPIFEPMPGETKLWNVNRVTALFAATSDVEQLCATISSYLPNNIAITLQHQLLADQVWERAWLQNFTAKRFGQRLWICPEQQLPTASNAVVVKLDPGLAFGTGSHPTTALCLEWLDQADIYNKTVLDYGCGSGILAICAAILGAKTVTAVDHDPQALEATHDNAIKNHVVNKLRLYAPNECPMQEYDIVLANILAVTLIQLAPQLSKLTSATGHLILSGVLKSQSLQVISVYKQYFDIISQHNDDEWVMLSCTHKKR